MQHSVYLAGPIDGLHWDKATGWREAATARLEAAGIKALSPLRAKDYLTGYGLSDKDDHSRKSVLSSKRGIMARDRFDATRCDVMLVNLLGARKISVGTVMEIAWADLKRTPVVAVMEVDNCHEHSMLCEAIDFRVSSLAEALDLVEAILK